MEQLRGTDRVAFHADTAIVTDRQPVTAHRVVRRSPAEPVEGRFLIALDAVGTVKIAQTHLYLRVGIALCGGAFTFCQVFLVAAATPVGPFEHIG